MNEAPGRKVPILSLDIVIYAFELFLMSTRLSSEARGIWPGRLWPSRSLVLGCPEPKGARTEKATGKLLRGLPPWLTLLLCYLGWSWQGVLSPAGEAAQPRGPRGSPLPQPLSVGRMQLQGAWRMGPVELLPLGWRDGCNGPALLPSSPSLSPAALGQEFSRVSSISGGNGNLA